MSYVDMSQNATETLVEKPKLARPPRYKVILHNDDFTPMDFVVDVLKHFFSMDELKANEVMLKVHYDGRAVCGLYSKDIAETKCEQVNQFSRSNEHPLLCTIEPE